MGGFDCFAAERDYLVNDLLRWRKSIARQTECGLHYECIGVAPLRPFGGFSGTQLEISRVKERFVAGKKETLRRAKDMAGGQQHQIQPIHASLFAKWQNVLRAGARQPTLHQARCALGNDDFIVWRNMIAMRVRNKSESLCVPWVEP